MRLYHGFFLFLTVSRSLLTFYLCSFVKEPTPWNGLRSPLSLALTVAPWLFAFSMLGLGGPPSLKGQLLPSRVNARAWLFGESPQLPSLSRFLKHPWLEYPSVNLGLIYSFHPLSESPSVFILPSGRPICHYFPVLLLKF